MSARLLPADASLAFRLSTGWRALQVLKDDAGDPLQGPLLNACLDLHVYERLVRELRASEEGQALLAERPSLQGSALDLDRLQACPDDTLGRAFADYFRANHLAPFETTFRVDTDVDFVGKRYRETHDLTHVLTGYGVDPIGEMELQAFMLGNLGVRSPLLIIAFATPLIAVRWPRQLWSYVPRLVRAFRRGRKTANVLAQRWERWWREPLPAIRARLQVV